MVDIAYLGFEGSKAGALTNLPLVERRALLDAPSLPFDGMNERGLAIGMAAVPLDKSTGTAYHAERSRSAQGRGPAQHTVVNRLRDEQRRHQCGDGKKV